MDYRPAVEYCGPMATPQTQHVLVTAVEAVKDLMEKRLRAGKGEDASALQTGLEELSVLWDELQSQNEQLARERQRFEDLFEFLPEACLITDVVGHVRNANRSAIELLQIAPRALSGKPLSVFIAAEERTEFRNRVTAFFSNDYLGMETWRSRILPRDGQALEAVVTVRAIHPPRPSDLCWLIRPAA
jgi:PAS domain S-box-containing protein